MAGAAPDATFFAQLAGNGVFLAFIALSILLTLVLPLVIAVVSGDSLAGEAGAGTLRYLLTVPAGRTRLLAVKYTAVVIFGLAACLLVTVVSLIMGVILFPVGPVTLLSGTTVSLGVGLLHLFYVTLYVAAAMAALGAIGLAISSLTEHPIGAIAAVLVLAVASEVADQVAQFAVIHPYLPTHFWLSFDSLLRTPIDTSTPAARAAVVRRLHRDLLLDRLGPLRQRRRHQLALEAGEVFFPELEGAARAGLGRVRRLGRAGSAEAGGFLAAQLDPADLAGDRLGQLAELQPADPLVRGQPLPGVAQDRPARSPRDGSAPAASVT